MRIGKEKRRDPRTRLEPPEVGLLFFAPEGSSGGRIEAFYVELINRSRNGALVRTERACNARTFFLQIYDARAGTWVIWSSFVHWSAPEPGEAGGFLKGVTFREPAPNETIPSPEACRDRPVPLPADYEFFRKTKPLKYICRAAVCPVLNSVTLKQVSAGARFITQGDPGDTLYVIRSGSCLVKLEKDGTFIPLSRCREGDIVGEMALLTGEPRSAHVEAETDLELWGLTEKQFERIAEKVPDFRVFLTDIVAQRFFSRRETARREIGKYLITDIIGRGSYSVVYKGRHTGLYMPVCVKMLKHDLAMDSCFQRAFREEARLIAALDHPNIVRVLDIEERYQTLFIIMEFLEGVPLRSHLDHGPDLSPRRIVSILLQACEGLAYAHDNGVVHRDIKPANLFLLPSGQLKILDFGVATPPGTEERSIAGTVHYMAPEQIACDPVDGRMDIYALGICAYEMVTGEKPYPGNDPDELLVRHLREDIPDPALKRPDIPEELQSFIMTACSRDPEERYQSCREALEALEPLAGRFGLKRERHLPEKKRMTTVHLTYGEADQKAADKLLEAFGKKARKLGLGFKTDMVA